MYILFLSNQFVNLMNQWKIIEYRMLTPQSKNRYLSYMREEIENDEDEHDPPKPEGATWTEDQWKAIMAENQDIWLLLLPVQEKQLSC